MYLTKPEPNPPRLPAGPMAQAARAAEARTANRMSAGTYVRLRRHKAGWSIPDLARAVAATPDDRQPLQDEFRAIEQSSSGIHRRRVAQMAELLDLDMAIYLALVGFAQNPSPDLPSPRICTGCGCTWDHACADKDGLCDFPDDKTDLCTACTQTEKD